LTPFETISQAKNDMEWKKLLWSLSSPIHFVFGNFPRLLKGRLLDRLAQIVAVFLGNLVQNGFLALAQSFVLWRAFVVMVHRRGLPWLLVILTALNSEDREQSGELRDSNFVAI
jgi:hypothetical protein